MHCGPQNLALTRVSSQRHSFVRRQLDNQIFDIVNDDVRQLHVESVPILDGRCAKGRRR